MSMWMHIPGWAFLIAAIVIYFFGYMHGASNSRFR